MRGSLGFLITLLSALSLPHVLGLFEDEVGQYEWMLQQLGQPTALVHSPSAVDRGSAACAFVATASGVVASMQMKDGVVQWRRVATTHGSIRLLRAGSRGLLSVTDNSFVQAWQGNSGDLTWQRSYSDRVLDLFIAGRGTKQTFVVIRESTVEARTMTGKHQWAVSAGSDEKKTKQFYGGALVGDKVCLAGDDDDFGLNLMEVDAGSGTLIKQSTAPADLRQALESGSSVVVDSHIVAIQNHVVTAYPLCGDGHVVSLRLEVDTKNQMPFTLGPWQMTPGIVAASNGKTTIVLGLGSKGLRLLRTFDGVATVGPVFSSHDDETERPVAVAVVRDDGTQIQLLDPVYGTLQPGTLGTFSSEYTAMDHGPSRLLLAHELGNGKLSVVLSAADHSLVGFHGSRVSWVREEALASIQQAVFHSRPTTQAKTPNKEFQIAPVLMAFGKETSKAALYVEGVIQQFAEKLFRFLTRLIDPAMEKPPKPSVTKMLSSAAAPTHSDELAGFGANKLILVATRASKLFAIEALTSEVVWQRYFKVETEPTVQCWDGLRLNASGDIVGLGQCGPWIQLLPSSSASYSELLVITPSSATDGTTKVQQQFLWLEPLTGQILHQEPTPTGASVLSIMSLPKGQEHKNAGLPFLVIDSDRRVHIMPPSAPEVLSLLEEKSERDRVFHYEVDRVAQVVQGFAVGRSVSGQQLFLLWNLELGSLGERIVAAAMLEHREWDHVPVHIKGDASILYKYINTNLLAVASEDTTGKTTSLNLYVLDTVTGHVLFQSNIPGASSPVHLVACDNWVVMHYWKHKHTRFEIVVVEFFESKTDDGPWNILFGGKQTNHTKSAHHFDAPVPLQQTYIFPAGVTSMGVTATLKGVTPRSILMALSTDHIFRVSKDLLNPRRPYSGDKTKSGLPAQFAVTKDEVIVPYAPVLPLKPTDVLTYSNPIRHVNGIVSSPTALESTSLVFCHGLDLFFTPVQTAHAYDVLSPGFNYPLLYAAVGAVVVLVIATSIIGQRRALQDRWK